MAKKWSEVTASPEFQSLGPDEQEAARGQYFDEVVAPQVPAKDLDNVRIQFNQETATARPDAAALGMDNTALPVVNDLGVETAMELPNVAFPGADVQETVPVQEPQPQLAQLQQAFEAKKNPVSLGKTLFDQGMQGATFGFADEVTDPLGAVISTAMRNPRALIDQNAIFNDPALADTLSSSRQETQGQLRQEISDRPIASILANLGGGLITGGAGASTKAGASITNSLRNGSLAARAAKGAIAGSASGGVYGLGSGEDGSRLSSAGSGAVLGAALGGALPLAGAGLASVNNKLGSTVRATQPELKAAASANYKLAEQEGGVLSSRLNDDIIDYAQSFGPKDKMAKAINGDSEVAKIGSMLESFRGQKMTLSRATEVDQALTKRLDDPQFTDKNGVLNAEGRQLLEVKNKLRDNLTNAVENEMVEGGTKGVTAYQAAVKDWSAQSQLGEIQRIVDRASYMDNPATALKTGFRAIAVNPGRLSKFPPEVQKAIKNAARDGDFANILRTELGSRLISTIAGAAAGSAAGPIGTVAGTAAGFAASRGARAGAEALQMGRVNKVTDAIVKNSSIPTKTTPLITKDKLQQAFIRKKK